MNHQEFNTGIFMKTSSPINKKKKIKLLSLQEVL